ncbi:hypothetical protein [Neisseria lactamica]|uniref:hypothetical protein n=1 Tax=Neisseria lactamica TaxID=486 RepID=UPI000E58D1AE|nr:hypothetical protein [Neisseria lactamica]
MGFSPPRQRQTETTAKQGQAGRWAEARPTADTTAPHSAEANQSSLHIFRQPNPNIKPFIVN